MRILFVCLGNICRSPTAEAVMRDLLEREGRGSEVEVDSAGTGGWHVGASPDERAGTAAAARGIRLGGEARRLTADDLDRYDLVVAMDRENLAAVRALAGEDGRGEKVVLLRDFDPERDSPDVPDPYYGGDDGFERVLDIVERSCRGLLEAIGEPAAAPER